MKKSRMEALETVILSHLACFEDGATSSEIAFVTGLPLREVSEAITFLVYAQKVYKSGQQRPVQRGRPAAIWSVMSEGKGL